LGSNKFGYLQIDILFAISLFFIFIFITYGYYSENFSSREGNFEMVKLNALSRDLCMISVSSPGIPDTWEENVSSMKFFGLKNVTSFGLSFSKLDVLNSTNYFEISDRLNVDVIFYLGIVGLSSNVSYLSWGYMGDESNLISTYSCYSEYGGELVQVYVEAWK